MYARARLTQGSRKARARLAQGSRKARASNSVSQANIARKPCTQFLYETLYVCPKQCYLRMRVQDLAQGPCARELAQTTHASNSRKDLRKDLAQASSRKH